MTASSTKRKAQTKAKSKPIRANSEEAASSRPEKKNAAVRRTRPNVDAAISKLDVSALNESDITSILLHCASVLHFRKTVADRDQSFAESAAGYCYTKAGDSSTVNIWSGGFKVGEASEAEARARGIPPCGG